MGIDSWKINNIKIQDNFDHRANHFQENSSTLNNSKNIISMKANIFYYQAEKHQENYYRKQSKLLC